MKAMRVKLELTMTEAKVIEDALYVYGPPAGSLRSAMVDNILDYLTDAMRDARRAVETVAQRQAREGG